MLNKFECIRVIKVENKKKTDSQTTDTKHDCIGMEFIKIIQLKKASSTNDKMILY